MNLENKIEAQRKRMEQEKNKLDMLMKKAKIEQRKADNHRKIVTGAVRQPHQHPGAQPQHHQVVRICRQEESQAQQDPGCHGYTLHAETFLKFARHGRGNR